MSGIQAVSASLKHPEATDEVVHREEGTRVGQLFILYKELPYLAGQAIHQHHITSSKLLDLIKHTTRTVCTICTVAHDYAEGR